MIPARSVASPTTLHSSVLSSAARIPQRNSGTLSATRTCIMLILLDTVQRSSTFQKRFVTHLYLASVLIRSKIRAILILVKSPDSSLSLPVLVHTEPLDALQPLQQPCHFLQRSTSPSPAIRPV